VEADGEIGLEFSISGLFIAFSSITTKTSDWVDEVGELVPKPDFLISLKIKQIFYDSLIE
jgi:hypothetical protein